MINKIKIKINIWKDLSIKKKMILTSLISFLLIGVFGTLLILFDNIGGYDLYSIIHYRLPKIPLLIIMGVGTPLSALLIQKVTRNKLADSGLIGVADSGIFSLSIISMYFPKLIDPIHNPLTLSVITPLIIAFTSLITLLLLYLLSIKKGVSPKKVIMMGIGLHIFFSGSATLIIYFNNGYEMNFFNRYLLGFIENKSKFLWIIALSIIGICILITLTISKKLDILESDEKMAKAVGIRTELLKFIVFSISAMVIGATVASVGSVALLGLFIPNIARSMVGNKTKNLLFTSSLLGISFLFIAQFININWLHISAPIGILLQLLIAPYFIFKIFKGVN